MKSARFRFVLTVLGFTVLAIASTGVAFAQSQCSSSITACGCTIGAPGNYTVAEPLIFSQGLTLKNGCIDIAGQDINLYAADYTIIGPGSDPACETENQRKNAYTGIHVLPGASNVSMYFTSSESYVCGWNYGLEVEGNNINIYYSGTYYDNIGILFNNASSNDCIYCYADYNVTGIKIVGGSGNQLNNSAAFKNSQYGFWIAGSKENIISYDGAYDYGYGLYDNKLAGIYLGCSPTGNVKPSIPCSTPTTGNSILANDVYENYKYGIALEKGSIDNQIQENGAYYNAVEDFIDGNGNCIYNQYLYNGYYKKTPSCID
ncbi:MAG: hypothetical protein ABSD39_16450 [Terriglobales bacterium]|jgi:hypothetical protein